MRGPKPWKVATLTNEIELRYFESCYSYQSAASKYASSKKRLGVNIKSFEKHAFRTEEERDAFVAGFLLGQKYDGINHKNIGEGTYFVNDPKIL